MKPKPIAILFFAFLAILLVLYNTSADVAAQDSFLDATNRGWEQGTRSAESFFRAKLQAQEWELRKQQMQLEIQRQQIELEQQRMALERQRNMMENSKQSSLTSEKKKECHNKCVQLLVSEQVRTKGSYNDEEIKTGLNNCMMLLCSD